MGIRQRLSDAYDALRGRQTTVSQEIGNTSCLSLNPLLSTYENLFAQVRPLIDRMKVVVPYGVGANGAKKPLSQTQALAQLVTSPNDDMGWAEFADLMFATWLTEPELNIHVWKKGRRVTGYTVLPAGTTRSWDGDCFNTTDAAGNPITLSRSEVMTLRFSRSPRNPQRGISPASSVIVWTQLDDLVAQYQRAYFENGAVPATITFIRASTRARFDEKRRELERGLKGARNRNKTVYAWRQQLDTGETGDEIEVKTIQGNNSTLAIKELVSIIDQRLRQSIGVSPFILGDDSSAKYDNAELSELQFIKYRVHPALVTFWSQFQHELDRVTGGVGYAIDFDLDMPELTDRLKIQAETKKTQTETLIELLKAGASPKGAVEALGLDEGWNEAANDIGSEVLASKTVPEVISTSETANEEPESSEAQVPGINQDQHKAKEVKNDALEDPMKYEPMWQEGEELEKSVYEELVKLAEMIAAGDPEINLETIKRAIYILVMSRANEGAEVSARALLEQISDEAIVNEINGVLASKEFSFSEAMKEALDERIKAVVDSYDAFTRGIVEGILDQARRETWNQAQIRKALQESMPRRQAELIARNEVHAGLNFGRYDEDTRLAEKYGLKLSLKWRANPGACDICAAMAGTEVPIGEAFPDHAHYHTDDGEDIEVHWEHNIYNADGKVPNPHPNCRCTFDEVFTK